MSRARRKTLWLFILAMPCVIFGATTAQFWGEAFVEGFTSLAIFRVTLATFLAFGILAGTVHQYQDARKRANPPKIPGSWITAVLVVALSLLLGSAAPGRCQEAVASEFTVLATAEALRTSLTCITFGLYALAYWLLLRTPRRKACEQPLIWTP